MSVEPTRPTEPPAETRSRQHSRTVFSHRDDLQGLRAVAVLLVVLAHAGVAWFRGGYVGVDVFFVLSGFVITGLLLKEASGGAGISIGHFYIRRAKRILPAATLTLVATDLAVYHFLNFVRAKQVVVDSLWATFFSVNWHFAQLGTDYFAQTNPASPIQHYWTLSVEEQFYLVWPTLLGLLVVGIAVGNRGVRRFLRRSRRRIVGRGLALAGILSAASLAWSIHYTHTTPAAAYFSTSTRVWELGLGALLAVAAVRVRPHAATQAVAGWVGAAAIVAAGVLYSGHTAFPGYAALLPTVGAALVIVAGIGTAPRFGVARVLSLAPMRYVGDRSYTLYLWHWPILIIAAGHAGHSLSVPQNLALVGVAMLVSIVTYAVYENPLRHADWSGPAAAFAVTGAVAAMLVVTALTLQGIDAKAAASEEAAANVQAVALGAASPTYTGTTNTNLGLGALAGEESGGATALPAVVAAARAAQRNEPVPAALTPAPSDLLHSEFMLPGGCAAKSGETRSGSCTLGSSSGSKTLVVLGDSHAMMWMPAITALADRLHLKLVPIIKLGCTPASLFGGGFGPDCAAWWRWAVRQAAADHPAVTIVGGGWSGLDNRPAGLIKGLDYVAGALPRSPVVVIGDPPGLDRNPVDCLLGGQATLGKCSTTWDAKRFLANQGIAESAGKYRFLDTTGWFCSQSRCPMVVGHTVVYSDGNHVTAAYVSALAPIFVSTVRRMLATSP